jgi:hypothetical protein
MKRIMSRLLRRQNRSDPEVELVRLTRLVRLYTVEQQQVPRDIIDLVTLKYLSAVPLAPHGQRFVIDRRRAEVRLE